MHYGQMIQKRRKDAGLTQESLAGVIGVTKGRICQIEKMHERPQAEPNAFDKIEEFLGLKNEPTNGVA